MAKSNFFILSTGPNAKVSKGNIWAQSYPKAGDHKVIKPIMPDLIIFHGICSPLSQLCKLTLLLYMGAIEILLIAEHWTDLSLFDSFDVRDCNLF